jgi:hypothetical protein
MIRRDLRLGSSRTYGRAIVSATLKVEGPAMTKQQSTMLQHLDPALVSNAVDGLRLESDRGVILVAGAIVDTILADRLDRVLRHGDSKARGRLLTRSSFSVKLDLAFCLGLIPPQVFHDLQLLNKLRNRCAHEWEHFDVTKEVISKYIQPMHMKRALDAANEVKPILFPVGAGPREMLVKTLASLATFANLANPQQMGPF